MVIVRPNGAGKSNQLSIVTVAGFALGWAGGGVRDAFGQRQVHTVALRKGAATQPALETRLRPLVVVPIARPQGHPKASRPVSTAILGRARSTT